MSSLLKGLVFISEGCWAGRMPHWESSIWHTEGMSWIPSTMKAAFPAK